jgi:hypothetical protein
MFQVRQTRHPKTSEDCGVERRSRALSNLTTARPSQPGIRRCVPVSRDPVTKRAVKRSRARLRGRFPTPANVDEINERGVRVFRVTRGEVDQTPRGGTNDTPPTPLGSEDLAPVATEDIEDADLISSPWVRENQDTGLEETHRVRLRWPQLD